MIQAPEEIERKICEGREVFGDCDDMATYAGALLLALGHRPEFIVVDETGAEYNHVFVKCHGWLDPVRKVGAPLDLGRRHETFKVGNMYGQGLGFVDDDYGWTPGGWDFVRDPEVWALPVDLTGWQTVTLPGVPDSGSWNWSDVFRTAVGALPAVIKAFQGGSPPPTIRRDPRTGQTVAIDPRTGQPLGVMSPLSSFTNSPYFWPLIAGGIALFFFMRK